ncbi:MAG: M20 family metallopeptidase [Dethiobacteria bacterium]
MEDYTAVLQKIEEEKAKLVEMAHAIHGNPEVGGQEIFASDLITGYLEEKGFKVWRGVGGLKTAFMASYGDEGFHVGFCSEYDALPEIGHGCGHNLIGIAGVAAGVALASSLGNLPGIVSIIGTPNEEDEGGKVDLVRAGVFDDVDAAMMFHPGCSTCLHVESLACRDYRFIFHGRSVHASTEPWEGRNALDAVIQTFNGINALRQYLKDDVRVHGIVSEGGLAPNVVPDRAAADFIIRSRDSHYLGEVVEKVIACARGAAIATGTTLEVEESGYPYDAMVSNRVMADLFGESLKESGYKIDSPYEEGRGSIDMGNVSRVTPSIHPVVAITDQWVPGHTHEFTALCDTEEAYDVMLTVGKAMALTGYKILKDKNLQKKILEEFSASIKKDIG